MEKLWAHPTHKPTPEQGQGWVFISEVAPELSREIGNCPLEPEALRVMAAKMLALAGSLGADIYQPGGSPAFLFVLGQLAPEFGVGVHFAHTERKTIETPLPDGSVELRHIFKFEGWTSFPALGKEAENEC